MLHPRIDISINTSCPKVGVKGPESRSRNGTWDLLTPHLGPRYMVEVGVHLAELAVHLLKRFPQLQYLGIDPYPGRYEGASSQAQAWWRYGAVENFRTATQKLRRFGERARLCRRSSVRASRSPLRSCRARWAVSQLAPWNPKHPQQDSVVLHLGPVGRLGPSIAVQDILFIDGEHDIRSVHQDLKLWAPRVRPWIRLRG